MADVYSCCDIVKDDVCVCDGLVDGLACQDIIAFDGAGDDVLVVTDVSKQLADNTVEIDEDGMNEPPLVCARGFAPTSAFLGYEEDQALPDKNEGAAVFGVFIEVV